MCQETRELPGSSLGDLSGIIRAMSSTTLRRVGLGILTLSALALLSLFAYQTPFLQDRLGWRISVLRAEVKYALSPPEEAVFTPDPTLAAAVNATLAAHTPTPEPTPSPGPTSAPTVTPTITPTPTPLPAQVQLQGIRHEYQKWNNCGPANLSMALSFWDWEGDQRPVAQFTKPNTRDKNVMPYELEAFVESETRFSALVRVGGDLQRIKELVAAGFPVVVEKGFEGAGFEDWMGHYEVVSGYDDGQQQFTVQDSYIMADLPLSYEEMDQYWRHFNYTYLVIYPPEREAELLNLLGPDVDEEANYQAAAQRASDEIFTSTGRPQFFAWFNRGTNLAALQDYAGAASAYDNAFEVYATLDPEERPWRVFWYQTGPYRAYYYAGRHNDVIQLATQTLSSMSEPVLEESYFWRGLARQGIGDVEGAIQDWRRAVDYHPDWQPALDQLQQVGAAP